MIDNGIKQPLRIYSDQNLQNMLRPWVADGGSGLSDRECVIVTKNALIPFQVRRRRSALPVTQFDLYTLTGGSFIYTTDILALIPVPTNGHLKIIQAGTVDNIVWNPLDELIADLPCGYHYFILSDSVNTWYSEVFRVVDFADLPDYTISILSGANAVTGAKLSKDGTDAGAIITSNKPF